MGGGRQEKFLGNNLINDPNLNFWDNLILKYEGQQILDEVHATYPQLLQYVYKEALSGCGKFGENSDYSANYLITSGHYGNIPSIFRVNEIEAIQTPRIALPKGVSRPGNVKIDMQWLKQILIELYFLDQIK